jgi:hypothetical protein
VEMPAPTSREYIRIIATGTQSASLFAVHVPKGKKVEDSRQKAGSR